MKGQESSMAKQTTFKVSKRGVVPIEVTFNAPENLSDPRWSEVVSKPDEDVNELAVQNLIIKIQSGARARLDNGAADVQKFVDEYKYGARTGGAVGAKKVTLATEQVKQAKFSKAQLEMLRAAGVQIEGMEAEEPELAGAEA
jgi:hypothetical protein